MILSIELMDTKTQLCCVLSAVITDFENIISQLSFLCLHNQCRNAVVDFTFVLHMFFFFGQDCFYFCRWKTVSDENFFALIWDNRLDVGISFYQTRWYEQVCVSFQMLTICPYLRAYVGQSTSFVLFPTVLNMPLITDCSPKHDLK